MFNAFGQVLNTAANNLVGQVLSGSGKIGIRTDKPVYVAGEVVTGTIKFFSDIPLQGKAVVIKCTGYEKAEWEVERSRSVRHGTDSQGKPQYKTEWYTDEYEADKTFFKEHVVLYHIEGTLIGEHTFPFQYKLPDTLPGSFHHKQPWVHRHSYVNHRSAEYRNKKRYRQDNIQAEGKIVYKLKATIDIGGFFAKDLKAKQEIVVHERLDQAIVPTQAVVTATVCLCCCIPRGKCTIHAAFSKTAYAPGEEAAIVARIENNSKSNVKNMNVRLVRFVVLNDKHGHTYAMRDVSSIAKYEGVPAKTVKDLSLPLHLPHDLNPSTDGQFVDCKYRLEVECGIDYAPDIACTIPTTIYAPQPPTWGATF